MAKKEESSTLQCTYVMNTVKNLNDNYIYPKHRPASSRTITTLRGKNQYSDIVLPCGNKDKLHRSK